MLDENANLSLGVSPRRLSSGRAISSSLFPRFSTFRAACAARAYVSLSSRFEERCLTRVVAARERVRERDEEGEKLVKENYSCDFTLVEAPACALAKRRCVIMQICAVQIYSV